MMVRFTVGDGKSIWLNSINIRSLRQWKTDAQGPTTRIEMVGSFFDYTIVDGTAEGNALLINMSDD